MFTHKLNLNLEFSDESINDKIMKLLASDKKLVSRTIDKQIWKTKVDYTIKEIFGMYLQHITRKDWLVITGTFSRIFLYFLCGLEFLLHRHFWGAYCLCAALFNSNFSFFGYLYSLKMKKFDENLEENLLKVHRILMIQSLIKILKLSLKNEEEFDSIFRFSEIQDEE